MKKYLFVLLIVLIGCQPQNEIVVSSFVKIPGTTNSVTISEHLSDSIIDLKKLSSAQLTMLKNEIYARKGYEFNIKDDKELFSKFDWYKPKYDLFDIDEHLSSVDVSNIAKIDKTIKIVIEQEVKAAKQAKYDSFTYSEFIGLIPEITIPYKREWEYKNRYQWSNLCSKESELIDKFAKTPIVGKIVVNDSIIVIENSHAGDYEVYTNYELVNIKGTPISLDTIRSYTDTIQISSSKKYFNEIIVAHNSFMKINQWLLEMGNDSLNNETLMNKSINNTTLKVLTYNE